MTQALNEKPNAEPLPVSAYADALQNGHYLAPPQDKDGKLWVRTSTLILAEPQRLYEMWRDLESIPRWQEMVTEVRQTGAKTSHWTMKSGGKTIEWDSEILNDVPGKRIAWRSIGGDSDNAGEVVFE